MVRQRVVRPTSKVQSPQGSGPLAIRPLGESSGFRCTLWAFDAERQDSGVVDPAFLAIAQSRVDERLCRVCMVVAVVYLFVGLHHHNGDQRSLLMIACRSGKACGRGCMQYRTLRFRGNGI